MVAEHSSSANVGSPHDETLRTRRLMTVSCAGCLCSALIIALGAALLAAAYVASDDWLGVFGGLLAGLGLLAALVSSAMNSWGFIRYLVAFSRTAEHARDLRPRYDHKE